MYNIQDSINKTYDFIRGLKNKGYKYGGYPVYDVTKEDLQALSNVGAKYGIPFEWLVNLIKHESASTFNPSITNSIGATGLIQFLNSTAKGLGTTTNALRKMTFQQQLVYVDKYLNLQLKRHLVNGKIPSTFTQGDVFMTIFYPISIGKPNYAFPDSVKRANAGISNPFDYVKKALKNPIFSLDEIPYKLEDFKKKVGQIFESAKETTAEVIDTTQKTIQKNPMITVLITTVVVLGVFTIYKTLKA